MNEAEGGEGEARGRKLRFAWCGTNTRPIRASVPDLVDERREEEGLG